MLCGGVLKLVKCEKPHPKVSTDAAFRLVLSAPLSNVMTAENINPAGIMLIFPLKTNFPPSISDSFLVY